ncbi:cytochrome c-type biogenesis protein [Nitratireductor basaltis]|uniref:Cytochrome c-type biogenesis protein n=1 Tax=Nitratireductor basaltis TaxID=472175 RepID=A0A084UCE7_9HYPH|nr:cytochrome c-type biogenesis protein [Nitratireductor basaltis]KFB10633.1 Cytochrome C biogenesis protein [Nitratireductor basaltis]
MPWKKLAAALLLTILTLSPANAVEPDEVLEDPVLEQRARDLSLNLRCMVCQNQSIDDSNADLARDLRVLVRERLVAGDTDEEVIDYIVDRYGEFVLLKPRFSWGNALLWGAPAILLLIGLLLAFTTVGSHRRRKAASLSEEEEQRLERILAERRDS